MKIIAKNDQIVATISIHNEKRSKMSQEQTETIVLIFDKNLQIFEKISDNITDIDTKEQNDDKINFNESNLMLIEIKYG